MAEITVSSITPAMVKAVMTDGNYNLVMSDRSGVLTANDICLQAIDAAFSTLQSKAEKASKDLTDITDSEYNRIITAFIYLAISEANGIALNWGSYQKNRKQALQLLTDLWGSATSDDSTEGTTTVFMDCSVQSITYNTKETKLFNNDLWN